MKFADRVVLVTGSSTTSRPGLSKPTRRQDSQILRLGAQIAAVIDGMRRHGLIGADGWLSPQGRAVKQRVEALTDDLAAPPYEGLEPAELDELMTTLEHLAPPLLAAQDFP